MRLLTIIASMIAQAARIRMTLNEERNQLLAENERLQVELRERYRPTNIIGRSQAMLTVYEAISQVAPSISTVLVRGESGVGKELVAHAILMGGVAYCLFRLINSTLEWLPSLLASIVLVLLISVSIEGLQGLLPETFHRGFSMSDIWASLLGSVIGSVAAIIRRPTEAK